MELSEDILYDTIIVGGGPAGLTAGLYCARAKLNTLLFEKGTLGGQIAITDLVENYPGLCMQKVKECTRTYGNGLKGWHPLKRTTNTTGRVRTMGMLTLRTL